jgi:endonuclease/exonuclease/phosphatase family metal-dependent hydrolase
MSFNIRGTTGILVDGINAWDNRRALNIATIQKYAPDIIGFQEAKQGNIEAYAKSLSEYDSFQGLGASRRGGSEFTAIYWKSKRFEPIEKGSFYLSPTPDKESLGWDSTLLRVAAWIKLREVESTESFFVLNSHFPHEDAADETRQHCAKLIIEKVKAYAADLPVVVMGDFNATPDSAAYQSFINDGFADSYTGQRVNTFHNFEGENYPLSGQRIDWILTKQFTTKACEVIKDARPPLYPSDHYPVLALLEK